MYRKQAPDVAVEMLLSRDVLPHSSKRMRIAIDKQLEEDPEIVELFAKFAPSLKLMFQFFAVMPTPDERQVLKRHAPRPDIDQYIGQALVYERFMVFASVFSLSSGTGVVHAALTNTDLAAIFLDSIRVERVDNVGGLTFEEFWEALVRMALVFYTRRGVENRSAMKMKNMKDTTSKVSAVDPQGQCSRPPSVPQEQEVHDLHGAPRGVL